MYPNRIPVSVTIVHFHFNTLTINCSFDRPVGDAKFAYNDRPAHQSAVQGSVVFVS